MLVNSNIHETIIRKLTGHSENGNLTQRYARQTEDKMLERSMWKAADYLTINEENRLKHKVEKLEVEKNQFDRLADKSKS